MYAKNVNILIGGLTMAAINVDLRCLIMQDKEAERIADALELIAHLMLAAHKERKGIE